MDFEAQVLIKRENPHHVSEHALRFEAADWDEAQGMATTLTLPTGYSAYRVTHVVSLERLM